MFDFVHINHLDDVRHAISEDFYLAERPWGYVINYHISAFPEIKDEMNDEEKALEYMRREFRGIKFDVNGNIIGRPFHKFFNWGEKEAEMAHFDFNQSFVIMDKLDGSMIHPMICEVDGERRMYWCSKMGPTDVGAQAYNFTLDHPEYVDFADSMLESGKTPIFEWCSRQQRIVVDYPEEALILTAVRDLETGQYMAYDDLVRLGKINSIPVVKTWMSDFRGIDQFIEDVGGEDNCEGYIIRFANGHMVKLKNAWYLNLHRAKDQLSNEKNVYRLVIDQHHDDLIPQLDDEARKALENFAADLGHALKTHAAVLANAVDANWKLYGNRRDFALNFGSKQDLAPVIFRILDGKDSYEALVDWLRDQTATQGKLDAAKLKFGQINWRSYYYPVDLDG